MPLDLIEWNIEGGWFLWAFAIVCLVTTLLLSLKTWINSDKNLKIGLWEIFRSLILLLTLVALFNPQRIQVLETQRKPQVICLLDESQSMHSVDLVIPGQPPASAWSGANPFCKENGEKSWRKTLL